MSLRDRFFEQTGLQEVSRPDPALKETDYNEYKRQAQAWRQYIDAWQTFRDKQLSYGASLDDLGITDQKEHGRAGYNKLMHLYSSYGNVDPNWTYDWVNGVKYHTGTSDESQHGVAVPISEQERREYQQQQSFGTHPGAYIDRMQSVQKSWIERALQQGQLTIDPRNGLIWDGEGQYFDDYGAVIDPITLVRTGGGYGEEGQVGFGAGQIGHVTRNLGPKYTAGNQTTTPPPTQNNIPPPGEDGQQTAYTPTNYYAQGYSRPNLKAANPMFYAGWDNLFGSPSSQQQRQQQQAPQLGAMPIPEQIPQRAPMNPPRKFPIDTGMPPREVSFGQNVMNSAGVDPRMGPAFGGGPVREIPPVRETKPMDNPTVLPPTQFPVKNGPINDVPLTTKPKQGTGGVKPSPRVRPGARFSPVAAQSLSSRVPNVWAGTPSKYNVQ